MTLKVLGSGSSGNCYILDNGDEALVIETGVPFIEVKKALDFDISRIIGAVISHRHLDHAKYADEYAAAGVQLLRPYDGDSKQAAMGAFQITAFSLVHDVPCWGFFIAHPECGNILYASDTEYIKYRFAGKYALNHILVEANYDKELIDPDAPNREHVLTGHMSIQTAVEFLRANDNPELVNVVLLHMSDKNSDEKRFIEAAQAALAGVSVYAAKLGLTIELRKEPF